MLSFWEKNHYLSYDFAIIGAGIVGLSVAATLAEKLPQARIVVFERGLLPTGASTKNAGFACFGSPTEILHDIALMGEDKALTLVEKRWQGLQKLRRRLGDNALQLEQKGGYELIFEHQTHAIDKLDYLNQLLKSIFKTEIFSLAHQELAKFGFATDKVKFLLKNSLEAQIDSGLTMKNLWQYVQKLGVTILTQAEVLALNYQEISIKNTLNGQENYQFRANTIIVCSNAFIPKLLPEIQISPGRGQVLVTKPIYHLPFEGTFHFEEGFYYFRDYHSRIILGGGRNEDLATETTTEIALNTFLIEKLKEKLYTIICPQIASNVEIDCTWAGIMGFSENKQPILAKVSPHTWVAFACNGMGVALSSQIAYELSEYF
ncbi:MAG: FAD-binding oxidoreductase [Microscillaceae bacterium]|nr:FAD-binding oxidoreductase [Microscillaceae bacterium]MDW8461752.1 FAD-dependent oxidoreductase [Cytophagales bacterium]